MVRSDGVTAGAPVAIWDRPVRVVHWAFVALLPAAWWTAEEHMFDWHLRIGMAMLALVVFRIAWGFLGSSTARFGGFVRGPAAAIAYLRGRWPEAIGHNPLGAFSVLALLAALALQVGLGLFASDTDGLSSGPLNFLVSYDTAESITDLHEANFNVILALVGLHLAAIAYYALKGRNLVRPMLTGRGPAPAGTAAMVPAGPVRLVLALAIALSVTAWVWAGAPPL